MSLSPELVRRHVEIIEAARAAINRGDFESVLEVMDDEIALHPAIGGAFVGATTYSGKDGVRRYFTDITEVIAHFRVDPLGFSAWRDYLIVPTRVGGHGTASGVDIEIEMTMIWQLRNGKVVWGATFFTRSEGLEAIGATERELELIE